MCWMNLAILGVAIGMSWIFGVVAVPGHPARRRWMVAGAAGVWLFYVQHQFEDAYWERGEDWDYTAAALKGSSFYKLPSVPAVVLRQHRLPPHPSSQPAHPELQPRALPRGRPAVPERETHHAVAQPEVAHFRLWDEAARKLVGFGHARRQRRARRRRGVMAGS